MKKHNTIFIFILILILLLSSCIIFYKNDFDKIRVKNIKLQEIKKDTLLSYENERCKILFSKSQVIEILESELSKRKKSRIYDVNSCIDFMKDLKTNSNQINIKSLSISNKDSLENTNYSLIFENWLLEKMLLNGNVIIFDKKKLKNIDYIIFKKSKDKMGSYKESFLFPDRTEFFISYIKLGE